MKKVCLFVLLVHLLINAFAQKRIIYPYFYDLDSPDFVVDSIFMDNKKTKVFCSHCVISGQWANIFRGMYIKSNDNGEIFNIIDVEGLPFSPDKRDFNKDDTISITLVFPSVLECKSIDIIEHADKKAFNIYGIDLSGTKQRLTKTEHRILSEISFSEGVSLYNKGDYEEAIDRFKECSRHDKHGQYKDIYVEYNNEWISSSYFKLGQEDMAKKYSSFYKMQPIDRRNTIISDSLMCIAIRYEKENNPELYLEYLLKTYETQKKEEAYNHPLRARITDNIGFEYEKLDSFGLANKFYEESLSVRLTSLSENNIDIIKTFLSLAKVSYCNNEFDKGDNYVVKTEQLLNDTTDTIQVALLLQECATVLSNMQDISRCISMSERIINLIDKLKSVYAESFRAKIFNSLCAYYMIIKQYDMSVEYGEKALAIREKLYDKDDIVMTVTMYNVGFAYLYGGRKRDAESLFSKVLDNICNADNNDMLEYKEAIERQFDSISMLKEFFETMRDVLGSENDTYLHYIGSLPSKLYEAGKLIDAIETQKNVTDLMKAKYGTNHISYITSLSNYMYFNYIIGNKKEALKLAEDIELQMNDMDNTQDISTIGIYNSLAIVLENTIPTKSLQYLEKILEIYHTNSIIDSGLLSIMSNLSLGFRNANIAKAIAINEEAIKIAENNNLTNNIHYAYLLRDRAVLYSSNNNESVKYYKEAVNSFKKLGVSHEELKCTEKIINQYFKILLNKYTILNNQNQNDTRSITELDSIILYYRKYNEINKEIIENEFPKLSPARQRAYRDQICEFYDNYGTGLGIWFGMEKGVYESEFMKLKDYKILGICYDGMLLNKGLLLHTKTKSDAINENIIINWNMIKESLKDGEIAIELFPFECVEDTLCFAFTLKSTSSVPELLYLCSYKELQKAFLSKDYESIYNLVWEKMTPLFFDVNKIYISTSEIFNRIAVEYAITPDKQYFQNKYDIRRLSSMRSVVSAPPTPIMPIKNVLLLGDLNYDFEVSSNNSLVKNEMVSTLREGLLHRSGFDPLPNTALEVQMICDLCNNKNIKTLVLSEDKGTEERIKEGDLSCYDIIHFATHGMYVSKENALKAKDENNLIFIESSYDGFGDDYNSDPLSRSFLVMSGGNKLPKRKDVSSYTNDGILTGTEISNLQLSNTKLVVLSACDSGLGDISNEGVIGLQYAFKKAGAKTILMSLDKVDDKATQLLMVEFYKNITNGLPANLSLKKAQEFIREYDIGQYSSHVFWGAFILLDAID